MLDPISEIKTRIAIEDLVSQYVPLKKAGRQFKALCPFHKERTPSFYVSPERQLAYCFGCHKGGDHFKFIQEIEGLDFRGALTMLAEKAGVTLPKAMPQDLTKKSERDRLTEIHEEATEFFERALWDTDEGKKALKYIKKRDFDEALIKEARLGFAAEKGDALFTYLLGKHFTRGEILTSGLAFPRDTDQGHCLDRFRNRLIFPIKNLAGQICAFGGRALRDEDQPKYLNSPETPIYHKSNILYGLSDSRTEIRQKSCVLLVEGYMDALACRKAGYKNVVASSGTALTEDQLIILKRFTGEVILAFDQDEAGSMAKERAIELAFAQEISVKVTMWETEDKDPDDCLRNHPKVFAEAVATPLSAQDYLLYRYEKKFGTADSAAKRKIFEAQLPFLVKLKSVIEVEEWVKKLGARLKISAESLYDELKRFQGKQKTFGSRSFSSQMDAGSSQVVQKDSSQKIQEYLLGLILTYPETFSKVNQLLKAEEFEDKELENIYRSLGTQYNQNLEAPTFSPEETKRAGLLSFYVETKLADLPWEELEKEVAATVKALKKIKFEREKRGLVERLKVSIGMEKAKIIDLYQELLLQEENFGQKT